MVPASEEGLRSVKILRDVIPPAHLRLHAVLGHEFARGVVDRDGDGRADDDLLHAPAVAVLKVGEYCVRVVRFEHPAYVERVLI